MAARALSNRLDVTFELITPAFAGAATVTRTDGLRIPALKSLIRFWWRTMFAHRSIAELHYGESEMFGSQDPEIGRRFVIRPQSGWRVPEYADSETFDLYEREKKYTAIALGYGPVQWNDPAHLFEFRTPRLKVGGSIAVQLQWLNPTSSSALFRALWLLSAFGGYGSRARRGWGSVRVQVSSPLDGLQDPHSYSDRAALIDGLRVGVNAILGSKPRTACPEFTSFGDGARVVIGPDVRSWHAALDEAKEKLDGYRRALGARYGHDHLDVGPDFQKRAAWTQAPGPAESDSAPDGAAFGLPNNAAFGRNPKRTVTIGAAPRPIPSEPSPDINGRRASPVFLKVLRLGNVGKYVPLFLWLPAKYLADDLSVWVDGQNQRKSNVHEPGPQGDCVKDGIRWFFEGHVIPRAARSYPWKGIENDGWTRL